MGNTGADLLPAPVPSRNLSRQPSVSSMSTSATPAQLSAVSVVSATEEEEEEEGVEHKTPGAGGSEEEDENEDENEDEEEEDDDDDEEKVNAAQMSAPAVGDTYSAWRQRTAECASYSAYAEHAARQNALTGQLLQSVLDRPPDSDKVNIVVLDQLETGEFLPPQLFGSALDRSLSRLAKLWRTRGPAGARPHAPAVCTSYAQTIEFFRRPKPANVAVRLVLAEDLSPATIEAVGRVVDVRPETFAEHLLDSNYRDECERAADAAAPPPAGHSASTAAAAAAAAAATTMFDRASATQDQVSEKDIWCGLAEYAPGRLQSASTHNLAGQFTAQMAEGRRGGGASRLEDPWQWMRFPRQATGGAAASRAAATVVWKRAGSLVDYFKPPPRRANNIRRPWNYHAETSAAVLEKFTFVRCADRVAGEKKKKGWTGLFLFDPAPQIFAGFDASLRPARSMRAMSSSRWLEPSRSFDAFVTDAPCKAAPKTEKPPRVSRVGTRESFIRSLLDRGAADDDSDAQPTSSAFHLFGVFHIIAQDCNCVVADVNSFLDEIDGLMSDHAALQRNVFSLRKQVGYVRKELVSESENIQATLEAIRAVVAEEDGGAVVKDGSSSGGSRSVPFMYADLERRFEVVRRRVGAVQQRAEWCFEALTSSMAIVESQRSIRQAESVSKLTELAFVFIPSSLATSVFGMEIPGWSENYRPYMFFAILFSLLAASYAVRTYQWAVETAYRQLSQRIDHSHDRHARRYILTGLAMWRLFTLLVLLAVVGVALGLIWAFVQPMTVKAVLTGFICAGLVAGCSYWLWLVTRWELPMVKEGIRTRRKDWRSRAGVWGRVLKRWMD